MTTKSLTGPAARPATKNSGIVCGNCKRSLSAVKVREGKKFCPFCGKALK